MGVANYICLLTQSANYPVSFQHHDYVKILFPVQANNNVQLLEKNKIRHQWTWFNIKVNGPPSLISIKCSKLYYILVFFILILESRKPWSNYLISICTDYTHIISVLLGIHCTSHSISVLFSMLSSLYSHYLSTTWSSFSSKEVLITPQVQGELIS